MDIATTKTALLQESNALATLATQRVAGSAKRGSAGDGPTYADLVRALGCSWAYNWAINQSAFNANYQHVPMIKPTTAPVDVNDLTWIAALPNAPDYWLLFNEPDLGVSGEDAVTGAEAAPLYHAWRTAILAGKPTAKMVVGNVFHLNTTWLASLNAAYNALYGANTFYPTVHAWGCHLYPGAYIYASAEASLRAFRQAMNTATGGMGHKLWLTEWGHMTNAAIARQMLIELPALFETWIGCERYAFWSTMPSVGSVSTLFEDDFTMTNLGRLYSSV